MRPVEIDSKLSTVDINERKFVLLGSEKTEETAFRNEFIIPKINRAITEHNMDFWGTLGMSDDSRIKWRGRLEISGRGNDDHEGVVLEEIEEIATCFPELAEARDSIQERFISFEHVDFEYPDYFTLEELPSLRLDLMLPQEHGAVVFYQSDKDSTDEETVIEYILPSKTEDHNTNERDRLTYIFDIVPQRNLEESPEVPGTYRLGSTKKPTPFIVKTITFKRSERAPLDYSYHRETSTDIIRRVEKTLAVQKIRNKIAKDHALLVFDAKKNNFVEAKKGDVRSDKKTLFLIHGTFGSTESSFGKLCGKESTWLRSFLESKLYDQILAFDHPTVFFGAKENVAILLKRLKAIVGDPFDQDMDFIGTSQGGLLVQYLANLEGNDLLKVGKAALVASANGVQYFTVGKYVCKFLTVLKQILKFSKNQGAALVASLAQHSAEFMLNQPGFRIMTPGDDKLTQIINVPPVYKQTRYLPIADDYDEQIIDDKDWKKLKTKLAKFGAGIVDGITGKILGPMNDWVVGTRNQYMVPADYCAIPGYHPGNYRNDNIKAIHGTCIYKEKAQKKLVDFFSGKKIEGRDDRRDLFDAHCHIFGRNIISARITLMLVEEMMSYGMLRERTRNLIELPDLNGDEPKESKKNIGLVARNIIRYFLLNEDSNHMLWDLEDEYFESNPRICKYVPLMFDLEMAFRNRYQTYEDENIVMDAEREFKKRLKRFEKDLNKLVDNFEKKNQIVFYGSLVENLESVRMLKIILTCLRRLKLHKLNLKKDIKTSYQKQIDELIGLKVRYGNSIYPFLAVDPRRRGIGKQIEELVGEGKPFHGIKLYAPNGHSPTDPLLFDKNKEFVGGTCLYQYCVEKNIPIMAHCSSKGFATFAMNLEVWGDICMPDPGSGEPVLKHFDEPTEIFFDSGLLDGGFAKAVLQRASVLNHPLLWRKVLEEYGDLKICFGHFGGESSEWRERIAGLMEHPNVYTDLSCIMKPKILKEIKTTYFDEKDPIAKKIMYGSDYFLNLINGIKFSRYYENFTEKMFSQKEMESMAMKAPRGFLF